MFVSSSGGVVLCGVFHQVVVVFCGVFHHQVVVVFGVFPIVVLVQCAALFLDPALVV